MIEKMKHIQFGLTYNLGNAKKIRKIKNRQTLTKRQQKKKSSVWIIKNAILTSLFFKHFYIDFNSK